MKTETTEFNTTIKNEIRNVWMSDLCALRKCNDCKEIKDFPESIYFCECRCHQDKHYGNAPKLPAGLSSPSENTIFQYKQTSEI